MVKQMTGSTTTDERLTDEEKHGSQHNDRTSNEYP